jgi:hypothetical protein
MKWNRRLWVALGRASARAGGTRRSRESAHPCCLRGGSALETQREEGELEGGEEVVEDVVEVVVERVMGRAGTRRRRRSSCARSRKPCPSQQRPPLRPLLRLLLPPPIIT